MEVDKINSSEKNSDDVSYIKLKDILLLFLVFIVVCSDSFVEHILGIFPSLVKNGIPTTSGVIIQGILVVIGFLLVMNLNNIGLL